jgi:hypothetical protein
MFVTNKQRFMKKITIYLGLALIFMINTASFCSRDEIQYNTIDVSPIVSGMAQGSWHITDYSDHGIDKTAVFNGYNFTFGNGNILTASNGSNTYNGTWIVTTYKTGDESPADPIDFNVVFEAPSNFADITDDWDIVSRTDTELILVDGTGESIDHITFEKN